MTNYFLGATDSTLTINDNNGNVYGATGVQILKIKSGVTNINANSNIEKFSFDSPIGSYKFQQVGTSLKVFDNTNQLVVDLGVRDDSVGTELTFANGTVQTIFFGDSTGAHIKVGGVLVDNQTPTTLSNPSGIDTTSTVGSTFTVTSDMMSAPAEEGKTITFTVTPVAIDRTTTLSIDLQGQALNSILAITTAADFGATSPIVFNVGDTAAKQITVNVINDGLAEGMEAYKARLIDSTGAEKNSVVGTIIDGVPMINFSANKNSVNEGGDSVNFTVTSDVNAPAGGITIPYALNVSIATSGIDFNVTPASGLITIPAGSKVGTLKVQTKPDDGLVKSPETVIATLTPISIATLNTNTATTTINDTSVVLEANKFFFSGSSSVNEGGKAVYTISHTPIVGAAITIPYSISGSVNGNDYTTSNPSPIIFSAGDTSKTIEFPMTNDFITEGNETFIITLGATSSVSDSVAFGQNSITTTVVDSSSAGASNTLRLTSIIETITGTDGNDVISAYIDTSGTTATLNAGDAINAGAGTDDTLLITTNGADAGALPVVTITGVETISVRETGGVAGIYNLSGISGLTTVINNISSDDLTFNLASNTKMIIFGDSVSTNGNTTFNSTDLTFKDGVNGGDVTRNATGITALTINSTGLAKNVVDTLDLDSANTLNSLTINASASLTATLSNDYATGTTVTIAGTASNVDLSGAALSSAITNVNAASFAGGVAIRVNQNDKIPDTIFTGGNGNDTLDIGKVRYNTTLSVNGGNGIDTLKISNQNTLSATTVGNISNFEQLEIYDDNDGIVDTFDVSLLRGITAIQIDAASIVGGYILNNLSASQAMNIVISGNQLVAPSFNVTNATSIGNIDTLGLTIDAGVTGNKVTVADINALGIEKINLNAVNSFTATTLTGLKALATLTVLGRGDVHLTTGILQLNLNSTIDATASTGMITVDASLATTSPATIAGISIKGSLSHANFLSGSAQPDILTGGAGADLINGGAGNDTLSGGGNADMLNGGEGSDVINGGTGADLINGGAGIDTLNGGSGDDLFSYAATTDLFDAVTHTLVDSVIGGSGTDSFLLGTTGTVFAIAATDIWTRATGIDALIGVANTTASTLTLDKSAETAGVKLVDLSSNTALTGNTINAGSFTATNATLIGSAIGATSIVGGAGNDTITGGTGSDSIIGGDGKDVIYTGGGNDSINLSVTAAGSTVATADAAEDQIYLPSLGLYSITGFGSNDKIYFTQSAFNNVTLSSYAEITTLPATPVVPTLPATLGIIAVGAATGTTGVSLYSTTDINAAAITNSQLLITFVGIAVDVVGAANFNMI